MKFSIRRVFLGVVILFGIPLLWVHIVKDVHYSLTGWNRIQELMKKTQPLITQASVTGRGLSSSSDRVDDLPVGQGVDKMQLKEYTNDGDPKLVNKISSSSKNWTIPIKILKISIGEGLADKEGEETIKFLSTKSDTQIANSNQVHRSQPEINPSPKKDCPNLMQLLPSRDQQWQKVTEDLTAFVYSAYWDERNGRIVRIIGMRNRSLFPELFCQIWFDQNTTVKANTNNQKNNNTNEKNNSNNDNHNHNSTGRTEEPVPRLVVVAATLWLIPEDHGRKYTACYFICPLHQFNFKAVPSSVSLVNRYKCAQPLNHMVIIHNQPREKAPKKQFTMCVSPLHRNYSRAHELVEWVEINRLFGADFFVFYNESINSNVVEVIQQYKDEGLAETVQWHLPAGVDSWPEKRIIEIHYFGQLAAINDCLYRHMYKSEYIVFMDVDEFIVPNKHKEWKSMIGQLHEKHSIGAYVFRCSFFRKEWEDTPIDFKGKDIAIKYMSVSLLKMYREVKIYPMFIRSKVMVRPEAINTMGIHNIWAFRPGYQPIEIVPRIAMLHHYRNWYNPQTSNRVFDDSMLKFKDDIIKMLVYRWGKLKDVPLE